MKSKLEGSCDETEGLNLHKMLRVLLGASNSGRMYGICVSQHNSTLERRHILGGMWSVSLYKNGFVISQGTLPFSRCQVTLYGRTNNLEYQPAKCCYGFIQPSMPSMIYQSNNLTVLAHTTIVSASNTESSSKVLRDKHLSSAIFYEAENDFRDVQGKNMRFSNFLYSKLLQLCSPLVHKSAESLLEEVKNYSRLCISDRLQILNKVSFLMGYGSVDDLIFHERALRECARPLQEGPSSSHCLPISSRHHADEVSGYPSSLDYSDVSEACLKEACLKFSSIHLGSSPQLDLYSAAEEKSEWVDCQLIKDMDKSTQPVDGTSFNSPNITETECIVRDQSNLFAACPVSNAEPNLWTLQLDKQDLHLSKQNRSETVQKEVLEGSATGNENMLLSKSTCKVMEATVPVNCFLDAPINTIKGIRPAQCRKLEENGFHTVRKLLQHFPRTYVNMQPAEGQVEDGQLLNFFGRILSSRGRRAGYSGGIVEVIIGCEIPSSDEYRTRSDEDYQDKRKRTVYIHLKRYFRGVRFTNTWILDKLRSKYNEGDLVSVSGKVKALEEADHFEIREYNIDVLKEEADLTRSEVCGKEEPCPIYPSKGDLDPRYIGECIRRVLEVLPAEMDPLPVNVCQKFNLMKLREAYFGIHCPKDLKEADYARRRLIFDDFFYHQLSLLYQRYGVVGTYIKTGGLPESSTGLEVGSIGVDKWSQLTLKVLKSLPFALTSAQLKAASEIIWDLRRPVPMSRLLAGDVGCGKTIVALLAALEVIDSGYQVAFMVPTELLAMQHHGNIISILERINKDDRPSVAVLTGSTPLKEARLIQTGLEMGDIALVVGTHKLFSETVNFASLCFAVIDEQHRFGVEQKGRFSSKACTVMNKSVANGIKLEDGQLVANKTFFAPHVLVMSATPIPRTMALALHGNMSLSKINELPPGRIPVKTLALHGNKKGLTKTYQMVQKDLDKGGRVFLVYSAIDESEQLPELHAAAAEINKISNFFKGYKCGLLHGRMNHTEKEAAIQQFKEGKTQVLLSTQVVEVGIDIPEATMMVIMNAERFGIAQLHQLRGRIGRGTGKSTCILVSSSAIGLPRLKILQQSMDGFELAEADLRLRGPGSLLGTRQSGYLPEFSIARLQTDGDVLEQAHFAAVDILQQHTRLDSLPMLKAEISMRYPLNSLGA